MIQCELALGPLDRFLRRHAWFVFPRDWPSIDLKTESIRYLWNDQPYRVSGPLFARRTRIVEESRYCDAVPPICAYLLLDAQFKSFRLTAVAGREANADQRTRIAIELCLTQRLSARLLARLTDKGPGPDVLGT